MGTGRKRINNLFVSCFNMLWKWFGNGLLLESLQSSVFGYSVVEFDLLGSSFLIQFLFYFIFLYTFHINFLTLINFNQFNQFNQLNQLNQLNQVL